MAGDAPGLNTIKLEGHPAGCPSVSLGNNMMQTITSPSVILSEDRLREVVAYFLTKDAFAYDFEAMGAERGVAHLNTLTWLSLATDGMCVVIPFGHPIGTRIARTEKIPTAYSADSSKAGKFYNKSVPVYEAPPEQLSPETVFRILKPLFFDPNLVKVAHGSAYDLASVTKYYGRMPCGPHDDTIILAWLLNENRRRLGLKYLVKELYSYSYDDEGVGREIEKYPFNMVAQYSYMDALYCWILYRRFRPQIGPDGLEAVHAIETSLLPAMARMRLAGAAVDEAELYVQKDQLSARLEEIKGRVYKAAGGIFNINSNPQKQRLLYGPKEEGGQGLRPWKLTDKGKERVKAGETPDIYFYSTDEETLRSYHGSRLARELLEYAETAKVLGTYILGYLGEEGNPRKPRRIYSGRIYADFVQYGTKTGRFSCREPNLQNIPRPYTDLGRAVRGLFVSSPGHSLIVADFAQIELVVLAHFLREGKLYEGFLAGVDPHRIAAAAVLNKRPEDVTKEERQDLGKTLGFAITYGAGVGKVASMANITEKRAREVLREHRRQFPEIYSYRDYLLAKCRDSSPCHITTLSGRKRRIPWINSGDDGIRLMAERQCFNSFIQGSAADIQKIAMIGVDRDSRRGDTIKMLMTVHDEIMLEAPDDQAQLAAGILRESMTGPDTQELLTVPLGVEINIARRWSDCK